MLRITPWERPVPLRLLLGVIAAMAGGAAAQTCGPVEIAKLIASDGRSGNQLGFSIAMRGETVVIGAPREDGFGEDSGAAYIFVLEEGEWVEQAKLRPLDASEFDEFGYSVAAGTDTVVVSAPGDDHPDHGDDFGAAYVFVRDEGVWTQQAKLARGSDAAPIEHRGDRFGEAVAIDGDTVVVGAALDDVDDRDKIDYGSVYVFSRVGGAWTSNARVLAPDGWWEDWFGASMSLDGDTLVIGAKGDDDNGTFSGSAHVFRRAGGDWQHEAKLLPAGGFTHDHFGQSVSVSGEIIVVGAEGASPTGYAYVFQRVEGVWRQRARLRPSNGVGGEQFGYSVSVSGELALIGACSANDDIGSAYLFRRDGGVWREQSELRPGDGRTRDYFGYSVCLDGERAAIGSPWDDVDGAETGSAYVFRPRSSLLFRESDNGSWRCFGFGGDCIPGWDHVGFFACGNRVWESHPEYPPGWYYDPESERYEEISEEDGVQQVHTPGTFSHDSTSVQTDALTVEIPIDEELAVMMAQQAAAFESSPFLYLCRTTDIACWRTALAPQRQKGEVGGAFTCVGLVERCAEEAGWNDGEGFVPDSEEWITVFDQHVFPALSPQKLFWAVEQAQTEGRAGGAPLQGVTIEPVDWKLVDPQGRRVGYTDLEGEILEIPGARISVDGGFGQYFIPDPLPGPYDLVLTGRGEDIAAFVGRRGTGTAYEGLLAAGEELVLGFEVSGGCPADLTGDGVVDTQDFILFLNAWASDDPLADWNSDGVVDTRDFIAFLQDWGAGCP